MAGFPCNWVLRVNVIVCICLAILSQSAQSLQSAQGKLERWQECDVFAAPTNTSGGWGSYAAHDFQSSELIDPTPLYVILSNASQHDVRVHKGTILDDYIYGVYRPNIQQHTSQVLLGYDMMYNHHPISPNTQFGVGPGYSQAKYTATSVKAGEQFFASYGKSDGGHTWFAERGLNMIMYEDATIRSPSQLEYLKSQYCSKIYSSPGAHMLPRPESDRLSPTIKNAGVGNARAKVPLRTGERIEIIPGMLMYQPFMQNTLLAPLVFSWDNLDVKQQESITDFANQAPLNGKVPVQYLGPVSDWKLRQVHFSPQEISIFPFAGRIGLVRRVGVNDPSSNCRLEITFQYNEAFDSATPILELVATKDIETGEVLKMSQRPDGTKWERSQLQQYLEQTGHPYSSKW